MKHHAKWVMAAAAIVAVVAGGLIMGSNMGFKHNMPLDDREQGPTDCAGLPCGPPAGENRMSLPLLNPYTDRQDLCEQLGIDPSSVPPLNGVVQQFEPNGPGGAGNGFLNFYACGSRVVGDPLIPALAKGQSVWMTITALAAPSSTIVVGSHDPGFAVVLEKGINPGGVGGPQIPPSGDNWVSPPLHTTSVVAQDFCDEIGPDVATVAEFDPDGSGNLGKLTTYVCGSGDPGTNFTYTKGRGIKVVLLNSAPATVNWISNHF